MQVQVLVLCCVLTAVAGIPEQGQKDGIHEGLLASVARVDPAPPYIISLAALRRNGVALKKLLPHATLPVMDPRRHYVLVVGVLACLVEYMNSDCTPADYDHEYYPAIDRFFPVLWQQPAEAVAKIEKFVNDINDTVSVIQRIVDENCVNRRPEICDVIIRYNTQDGKEYEDILNLIIVAGKLAFFYEMDRYIYQAKHYDSLSLLMNGREKLKPLVYRAARVYKLLYGKNCQP